MRDSTHVSLNERWTGLVTREIRNGIAHTSLAEGMTPPSIRVFYLEKCIEIFCCFGVQSRSETEGLVTYMQIQIQIVVACLFAEESN